MALPLGTLLTGKREIDAQHVIDCINAFNFLTLPVLTGADSGATQTLTAAMVSGGGDVYHVSAGGATPTLTMPTAAAIITAINASFPSFNIGMSYKLTIVNTNSGTATIAAGTGITTSGTLTLATNTSRTFIVTYSAAGALTMTSLETGTTS